MSDKNIFNFVKIVSLLLVILVSIAFSGYVVYKKYLSNPQSEITVEPELSKEFIDEQRKNDLESLSKNSSSIEVEDAFKVMDTLNVNGDTENILNETYLQQIP